MLNRLFDRGEERSVSMSQFSALLDGWSYGYSPTTVTTNRALGHSASFACIDSLCTSVSTLPVDVVRSEGRRRVVVEPTPTIVSSPSAIVDQDVWVYQLVESMCTDGNGFGLVVATDRMQRPTQIELLDPSTVQQREVIDGVPQAWVDSKRHRLYPYGDLWHVPGKMVRAGSPFADSPLERAMATIGTALAAREYGSRFFSDGGHPSTIIKSERELTAEQARTIKNAYLSATRGNREPAVMGAGLSLESVSVDPEKTQFVDLMRFCIEEACRFWRVPPSMVYAATSGQNVTYANVSQADLHYLKHSLDGYLVRVERAWSKLIARPQNVRFNRNAFLRSDPQTRHDIYDKRLRNKTITVDEVRALEDEDPFGGEYAEPGIPGMSAPPEEDPNGPGTD